MREDLIYTISKDALPRDWSISTIGEIVGKNGVFVDGDWVESKDQDPAGDVRLIQLADLGDGKYRNKSVRFLTKEKALELGCTFLERGDILIARMPDPLGRACIFPGDSKKAVTVVDIAIVRPSNKEIDRRWLMHFINSPEMREAVGSLQSGSTRKRISRKNLGRIALPVPPPDKQQVIADEIGKQFSRLDEAVAGLKRIKANLKRYKAAVLKAAVEGKLTEEWRKAHPNVESGAELLKRILAKRKKKWEEKNPGKKYKEPVAPDTSNLPELPQGWTWTTLDQLSWDSGYGTSAKCSYENDGPPVLRIPNVEKAAIDLTDVKFGPADLPVIPSDALSKGDMLIIRTNGSRSLIGGAAIITSTFPRPTIYASYLIRFRLLHDASLPEWVLTYWQSPSSRLWIESRAATSAGQHNISMSVLSTSPIPLPPTSERQSVVSEIDRQLSIYREVEGYMATNCYRIDSLRHAVLSKFFTGGVVK